VTHRLRDARIADRPYYRCTLRLLPQSVTLRRRLASSYRPPERIDGSPKSVGYLGEISKIRRRIPEIKTALAINRHITH